MNWVGITYYVYRLPILGVRTIVHQNYGKTT